MVQWVAVLAVLVCVSDSSLSRSWFGFDDDDDFDATLSEPDDDELNQKSKYHGRSDESWESDEDYDDSSFNFGYGIDRRRNTSSQGQGFSLGYGTEHNTSTQGHPYKHAFSFPNHAHHQLDHHGFGHYDDKNKHTIANGHKNIGTSSTSASPQNDPEKFIYNDGNAGHHGYFSHHGYPSQTGSSGQLVQNSSRVKPLSKPNLQDSGNDADRIVFPDSNSQTVPITRPTGTSTTDRTLLDQVICVRACPATAEYNPVCGTNNQTYNNPGALQCARNCGVNVAIARRAPCPRSVPRPTNSTTSPVSKPSTIRTTVTTRRTQNTTAVPRANLTTVPPRSIRLNVNPIRPNSTLTSLDHLQNVFDATSIISNTEDPEFDIDKRKLH